MLLLQPPPLSVFPHGVPYDPELSAAFALFIRLWVIVGLGVLGVAIVTAIHDIREVKRQAKQATEPKTPFTKAA